MILATSLVGITSCSNDVVGDSTCVSEDNEIRFATGVVSANTRAITRANYDTEYYSFLPLSEGTNVHIKTEGAWEGKGDITHYTSTGTAGAATDNVSPIERVGIYWDDYGIGDPTNSVNRTAGVNVYAACVDGKDASAIGTISNWESLSWTLSSDMSAWKDKDLLFSNNNSDNAVNVMNKDRSGRYKFDTQKGGTACNLELHHAMSKITVNLKAGKGFPVVEGASNFENDPIVTLSSFNLEGEVNIKTLTAIATGTSGTSTLAKAATATTGYTATYEGLVFPGNVLTDTHKATAKSGGIAKINCDGNIFTIYADEIMDAMNTADADYVFHSGKNYILNITVDKTEIKITATVTDWIDVEATPVTPKIEVATSLGDKGVTGEGFTSFDFYMRKDGTSDNYAVYGGTATGTKADGSTPWTFTNPIYWPSHDTHYHMRGVYPTTTTVTDNVIAVANATYNANAFPSNLMIGAPELAANTMCDNADHTAVDMSLHGICAREASINLNFRYMLSQVEVHLESTGDDAVRLDNAVVEVLNGYTNGSLNIDTRTITPSTKEAYTILHSGTEDAYSRHAVVIPQNLTNGDSEDLQFRITITNADGTQDYYYATIKDVEVAEGGGAATTITSWEPGKRYVYTLNMKKTKINVTATIKDWITATGGTSIWM